MLKTYWKISFIATVFATAIASAGASRQIMVTKEGGVYKVYDPRDNTTVWVKDVRAYMNYKYRHKKVDGFDGKISNKEFSEGSTPVADAAGAAADTVSAVSGAAQNAANRVPSWRKYTMPIRAIFGSPEQRR